MAIEGGRIMVEDFQISEELKLDQKIYRYINIKEFISMIENKKTCFTRVVDWEDTWEAPLKRIPVDSDMEETDEYFETYEYIYGQCWSKNAESDAMWRIYSSNKDGIMIQSSVKTLVDSLNLDNALIAPVIYFSDLQDALDELDDKPYDNNLAGALLKRRAFSHEEEVRLLSIPFNNERSRHVEIEIEPNQLIERIILDPRCEKWYLDTIVNYCKRVGLSVIPYKSDLYEDNIYEKNKMKIYIRQVPDAEPNF